jgi:hypothetical protein
LAGVVEPAVGRVEHDALGLLGGRGPQGQLGGEVGGGQDGVVAPGQGAGEGHVGDDGLHHAVDPGLDGDGPGDGGGTDRPGREDHAADALPATAPGRPPA